MKEPAVYIMASRRKGTLYIGVTSDLIRRIWQHREGLADGFTKRYGVKMLVWFERHETMETAIAREKALKKWRREWKTELIEKANPGWRDLWPEIVGDAPLTVTPALNPTLNPTPNRTVIPAQAGIHDTSPLPKATIGDAHGNSAGTERQQDHSNPDSRFRGDDGAAVLDGESLEVLTHNRSRE